MASAQRLRTLIQELQNVSTTSDSAKAAVERLSKELEFLVGRAEGIKLGGIAGTHQELATTQYNILGITNGLRKLREEGSTAFNKIAASIHKAVSNMQALNAEQAKLFASVPAIPTGALTREMSASDPFGGLLVPPAAPQPAQQRPPSAEDVAAMIFPPGITAGAGGEISTDLPKQFQVITGTAQQLGAALKDNNKVLAAAEVGIKHLQDTYQRAGVDVKKFTVGIDAANNALQVQAKISGSITDPNLGEISKVTGVSDVTRVGIMDARVIDRAKELQAAFANIGASATGVKTLQTELSRLGFTLENVSSAEDMVNEGLLRFNVQSQAGAGITRRANIVMNRQGEIVETVKRKYEGMGTAIANNITKVIRWGIAMGVVYGGLQRIRSTITEMINLQTAFADIQIITGRRLDELGNSLDAVVEAAEDVGITLGEATATFEKALRAAGHLTTETERIAKAEVLMTDALVLARLANVDQAQAMDMLTGALRQQGLEIDQGSRLLDKWVATSKIAFVGLQDLAESFAITAAQARSVGVSVDELNGIIATIATVTTLSSTEIGNMARTMLSALESDTATKTLREYGVAIKGISGDFRDWGDVVQDVFDLYRAEAITERELSVIGRALGGGARRGPQIVAFIKEYGMVNEIAAESAKANGDAAEALDIKMETLRNGVKRLQVAFSKLALTLGEEGGLLDTLSGVVGIFSTVMDSLTGITSLLGDSTIQIIAFVAAWATMSRLSKGGRLSAVGTIIPTAAQKAGLGQAGVGSLQTAMPAFGQAFAQSAISYMATGNWTSVAATFAGSIIGYAGWGQLGGMLGGLIGSSIISKIVSHEELLRQPVGELPTTASAEAAFEDLAKSLFGIEKTITGVFGDTRTEVERLQAALTFESGEPSITDRIGRQLFNRGIPERDLEKAREIQERINTLKAREATVVTETVEAEEKISELALRRAQIRKQYTPGLEAALTESRGERVQQFAAGEMPRSAFTRFLQVSERLPVVVTNIFDLLGEEMQKTFGEGQEAFTEIGMALADLDPAAIQFIVERLERVAGIRADIADIHQGLGATATELEYAARLQEEYAQAAVETSEEIVALIENAKAAAREAVRPEFTRYDISQEDFAQVQEQALQNQLEYAKFVGETPDEFASAADDWNAVVEDGLTNISGLWKVFFEDALQIFMESKAQLDEQMHVRRLKDVDPSRFGEIQARNRYWIEFLARMRGQSSEQYLAEEGYQENLILGPNNVWQKILTSSEAMAFTLQDILETEKKQLEGMWNIPTGATFWVPLTSLFYQNQQQQPGVPGLPPIDEELVEELKRLRAALATSAGTMVSGEEMFDAPERRRDRSRFEAERAQRGRRMGAPPPETLEQLDQLTQIINFLRAQATEGGDPQRFFQTVTEMTDVLRQQEGESGRIVELFYQTMFEGLAAELKPLMPDVSQEEIATLLGRAAEQLLEASEETRGTSRRGPEPNILQKIGESVTGAHNAIMEFFANPMEMKMSIQLEAEKNIVMQNIISLDGSVIKQYVSEITAREIAKSARASGFNATLMS